MLVICFESRYVAFAVIATKAALAEEDGVGAVGILSDLDFGFDKMRAQRAFGDLQFEAVERHAIVIADLTLFLEAEYLIKINTGNGHKGCTRLR